MREGWKLIQSQHFAPRKQALQAKLEAGTLNSDII